MSGLTDRNVDSFKNFVDRLLKFPDQEIDLDLKNLGDTLPALLFTCHSLVTLKLDAVDSEIKVPSDVCLGNLKTLQLRNSSPSLKRLVLEFDVTEGRYFNYVVVINAPILVYFQYHAAVAASYTLSTMKSLEKADISIYQFDSINSETSATHLIQGICNVRSLSLTTDAAIFLTSGLPIFHNLIEFKYLGVGFNGRETWLVEFLHCVPNLKTLTLNFPDDAGTRWKALRMKVPSCLSFHLKEIEISYFDPRMIEMGADWRGTWLVEFLHCDLAVTKTRLLASACQVLWSSGVIHVVIN
ncbi:hypothetical protein V6Z12_D02G011200 [Gossypium hirsutum]